MSGSRGVARAAAVALMVGVVASGTGCRLLVELVESDDAASAGPDAFPVDPDCGTWELAPAGVDACDLPAPGAALMLGAGAWTLDTNSGALTDPAQDATFPTSALLTQPDGTEVRVLSVERFELEPGAELRVHGARPLLIVAWSVAAIDGVLDLTSRPGAAAAGADHELCAATVATVGGDDLEGGGGGGGGGFGGDGAPGGTGNDGAASGGDGGIAAVAGLRGGCAGAAGGNPLAGVGGAGGGAVHIAARDQVIVEGVITAGGAGGGASRGGRAGGGGGGSGGYVGLESPSVVVGTDAVVAANGGAGGGGSDGSPALPGADGQASASPAAPGSGQGMGAGGGAGGALDAAPDAGLAARRGGGGGGGGGGWIVILGAERDLAGTAVVSPVPQLP